MTGLSGQCLCGAVKFTVQPKPQDDGVHVDVCHCSMCRRWTGGPGFAVELEGPPVFADETSLGVYQSSDWAERLFCKTCGSSLFYRLTDGKAVFVQAGALDAIPQARFTVEIFIDEKPDYYDFAQPTRKMTGEDVFKLFAPAQDPT